VADTAATGLELELFNPYLLPWMLHQDARDALPSGLQITMFSKIKMSTSLKLMTIFYFSPRKMNAKVVILDKMSTFGNLR